MRMIEQYIPSRLIKPLTRLAAGDRNAFGACYTIDIINHTLFIFLHKVLPSSQLIEFIRKRLIPGCIVQCLYLYQKSNEQRLGETYNITCKANTQTSTVGLLYAEAKTQQHGAHVSAGDKILAITVGNSANKILYSKAVTRKVLIHIYIICLFCVGFYYTVQSFCLVNNQSSDALLISLVVS